MQHQPATAWFEILGLTIMGIIVLFVIGLIITMPRKEKPKNKWPRADLDKSLGQIKDGKIVYLDEHENKLSS